MSKKFKVGDRVRYIGEGDAMGDPKKGAVGTIMREGELFDWRVDFGPDGYFYDMPDQYDNFDPMDEHELELVT